MSNNFDIDKEISDLPVLILAYNRPEKLKKLLLILSSKFSNIYLAIDGPKNNLDYGCFETQGLGRQYFISNKNKLRISDVNLGLKDGVKASLNWFFQKEKRGIILEDDLLFSPQGVDQFVSTFANFCESGTTILNLSNFIEEPATTGNGKSFNAFESNDFFMWGWYASDYFWKDYLEFEKEESIKDLLELVNYFTQFRDKLFWLFIYLRLRFNQIDSWGYRISIYCYIKKIKLLNPQNIICVNQGLKDGTNFQSLTIYNKIMNRLTIDSDEYISYQPIVKKNKMISYQNYMIRTNPTLYQTLKNIFFFFIPIDKKIKKFIKR